MPTPIILVVGLGEGSGKTVLASSLAAALRREGVDAVLGKPISGVDLWRAPWILKEWERRRLVVGPDLLVHEQAMGGAEPVEVAGPLVLAWAPRDPSRSGWRGPGGSEPVAGRVTTCRGGRAESLHFVDVRGLERVPRGVAERVVEAAGRLVPLPVRADRSLSERVATGGFILEADACMRLAASRRELLVLESQADVAVPSPLGLEASLVVVAGYGVAGLVDGDRWRRAVEVAAGSGLLAVAARDILRLTGVEESIHLPFTGHPLEGVPRGALDPLLARVLALLGRE